MNPDKCPDFRGLYAVIKGLFLKTEHFCHGPYDETFYSLRVYETAKKLVRHFKCRKNEILVAAILHDVGKTRINCDNLFGKVLGSANKEEWDKHPELGVPIAKEILKKFGHSDGFIERVCFLIANHSKRGDRMKDKPLDLQILQDADLIADWGFAGFLRPFLYCGKFGHQTVFGALDFGLHGWDPSKDVSLINLDVSKKIAEKRLKVQKKLFDNLAMEVKSDLL